MGNLKKFVPQSNGAFKINKTLLVLCIAFGLSSSFSSIAVFDMLNKAIIGLMCLVILAYFWNKKQPRYVYLVLAIAGLLHALCFLHPLSSREGIATYFTFAFWVLFWLYLANNMQSFLSAVYAERLLLKKTLILWTAVTAVSFAFPFCYKVSWGGESYFVSFTLSSFEIAPIAVFMLAIDILLYRFDGNKVRALLLSVVPLACVFATGTRTYLVVIVVEFLILLRLMMGNKASFVVVSAIVISVVILIASVTSIGQKFESAMLDTRDTAVFLEVFTNGRSEFWEIDMRAFLSSDFFELMFGHGFSYVYDLNEMTIGNRLYAHNDFINILLNFGWVGMLVYFAAFGPISILIKKRLGVGACLLFLFMWFFNAFFNMIYVYVVAVIGMGLLAAALVYEDGSFVDL